MNRLGVERREEGACVLCAHYPCSLHLCADPGLCGSLVTDIQNAFDSQVRPSFPTLLSSVSFHPHCTAICSSLFLLFDVHALQDTSDLTIVVGDRQIHVHKALLKIR